MPCPQACVCVDIGRFSLFRCVGPVISSEATAARRCPAGLEAGLWPQLS